MKVMIKFNKRWGSFEEEIENFGDLITCEQKWNVK